MFIRCFVEFHLNFVAKTWVHPLCQKREEENKQVQEVFSLFLSVAPVVQLFLHGFFLRNLLMFSKPWYLLLNKQMFLFSFSQNFLPPSVFSSPTLDKICSSKRKGKNERFLICFFLSALAPVGQIFLHEAFLEKNADDFKILKGQFFARFL